MKYQCIKKKYNTYEQAMYVLNLIYNKNRPYQHKIVKCPICNKYHLELNPLIYDKIKNIIKNE